MKILVACEESQAVTKEFRRLGHEAYSCDIIPCSGGHPEWHLQVDALELLKIKWDMIIAHPPCTYMSKAGARWMFPRAGEVNQDRLALAMELPLMRNIEARLSPALQRPWQSSGQENARRHNMTYKEVITALRSTPSRSKRELFDTAADMIEQMMDKPVVSNADRIRAMSDDEFSEFLIGVYTQVYWDHPNDIEEWLKQPAEVASDVLMQPDGEEDV